MNEKKLVSEINHQETYELWDYPSLEDEFMELHATPEEGAVSNQSAEETQTNSVAPEILKLEELLHNKIKMIDEINDQMKQVLDQINEELLLQIAGIIKKVTRKIIDKELVSDKETLLNMINATLTKIKDHQECEVMLSPDDFKQFNEMDLANMNAKFSVSSDLKSGDYKIKTDIGEVWAILEDRLTVFFG